MSGSKGFGLTTLAVKNAKTVFLITLVVIIGGIKSIDSPPPPPHTIGTPSA